MAEPLKFAESWVAKASGPSIQRLRRSILTAWSSANGASNADALLASLPADPASVYESVDVMVKQMKTDGYAPGTIFKYRSYLPRFLKFAGLQVDGDNFDVHVTKVRKMVQTERKIPAASQIKEILSDPDPRLQALIVLLVSTGARINEALQVRLSDISFDRKPTWVTFRAETTKTGMQRVAFLCSYATTVVSRYIQQAQLDGGWLFPGTSKHLHPRVAYESIMRVLQNCGLDERSDVTGRFLVHPHSFRVLNLAIVKSARYPWDWAEHHVGHALGTGDSYLSDDVASNLWAKLVDHVMDSFLQGDPDWSKKAFSPGGS